MVVVSGTSFGALRCHRTPARSLLPHLFLSILLDPSGHVAGQPRPAIPTPLLGIQSTERPDVAGVRPYVPRERSARPAGYTTRTATCSQVRPAGFKALVLCYRLYSYPSSPTCWATTIVQHPCYVKRLYGENNVVQAIWLYCLGCRILSIDSFSTVLWHRHCKVVLQQ